MLFVAFVSAILGALGAVLLQVILFCVFLKSQPPLDNPRRHQYERAKISEDLRNLDDKLGQKESAHSLNAIFGFLFGELKDTNMIRRWVVRKMNVELDELLQTKTAGRVLEQITVRDYCLGSTVPTINSMSLIKCNSSSPGKAPEEVDVALSLTYNGGFRISVDVDLAFGTSAYVSITVSKLEGKGRLSFTRHPYSHWSFSFFEEPVLEFSTKTHFEGRVVPQLSGLIVNQIKKTIRKKHILPAYKLRYKPFFVKPDPPGIHDEVLVENSKLTVGTMQITVVECSRLPFSKENEETEMYCSVSIDAIAWKQDDIEKKFLGEISEVEIYKGPNKFVGVTFQSGSYEKEVLVSTISPESPAVNNNLRRGDRVLYVDGVKAQTPKQVARLVKQAKDKFTLKVQRPFLWTDTMSATVSKSNEDQRDAPLPVDEPDDDNEYEEFSGPIIATFKSLEEESRQRSSSPSRLEVPSNESPVLRRRNSSKQPTTDDGRRLSSSLDYETAKQLREKLQQTAEEKLKNVKTKIQESIQARKDAKDKKGKGNLDSEDAGDRGEMSSTLEITGFHLEADPDTVSLSSLSQYDEPQNGSVDTDQLDHISLSEESGIQETTLVPAVRDPRWDEPFTFQTKESDCYINVCVWNRIRSGTFGERDIILGYTSIPLIDVAMQCLATLSGEYLELFKLQPPELQSGASRNPAQAKVYKHPGYEHRLSFGDITLFFKHDPQEAIKPSEVKEKPPVSDREKLQQEVKRIQTTEKPARPHPRHGDRKGPRPENPSIANVIGEAAQRLHVFLGTHFSMPTRCDFCTKKVWTKFAYQCQGCHLICHKKCSDKTQINIPCDRTKKYHELESQTPLRQPVDLVINPPTASSSVPSSHTASRNDPPQSPPSPTTSSSSSEDEGEDDEDIEVMIRRLDRLKKRLLRTRQNAVTKKEEVDHMVMTVARENGRELFLNLPTPERKFKLETIINKLQKEIDTEAEQQAVLYLKKEDKSGSTNQRRAAASFSKSEQRIQTLAMLMLHYCSGIQHCNEELSNQADEAAAVTQQAAETDTQKELETKDNECTPSVREPDRVRPTASADVEDGHKEEGDSGGIQHVIKVGGESSSSEDTDCDVIIVQLPEQS